MPFKLKSLKFSSHNAMRAYRFPPRGNQSLSPPPHRDGISPQSVLWMGRYAHLVQLRPFKLSVGQNTVRRLHRTRPPNPRDDGDRLSALTLGTHDPAHDPCLAHFPAPL